MEEINRGRKRDCVDIYRDGEGESERLCRYIQRERETIYKEG